MTVKLKSLNQATAKLVYLCVLTKGTWGHTGNQYYILNVQITLKL